MAQSKLKKNDFLNPAMFYFRKMSEYLILNAKLAYNTDNFIRRCEIISNAAATESASMLCLSLGRMDVVSSMIEVFYKAAYEASISYSPLFRKDGTPVITVNDRDKPDYKDMIIKYDYAKSRPGFISRKYLPEALSILNVNVPDEKLLDMIDLIKYNDLILLAANWLLFDPEKAFEIASLKPGILKDNLWKMIEKGHYSYSYIENIPLNDEGLTAPLTSANINFLETAIRLGNCTWKSGQVHAAHFQQDLSRIDPNGRSGGFNVDEQFRYNQFIILKSELASEELALQRIAFEFYKTIYEYKMASE